MNLPNSALAYFTPTTKPATRHRIHAGTNGVSSNAIGSNDLIGWFSDALHAISHYAKLGFKVELESAKYGTTWIATKV